MKNNNRSRTVKLTVSAMCMALAYVLPFVTAGIPEIGNMLCPMHIPVMVSGFVCGPFYGLAVGIIAPILRSLTLGVPTIFPKAFAMAFELAAYGFFCGLFYKKLPKKTVNIYVSLIASMIIGRLVWGTVRVLIYGLGGTKFGWAAFLAGAFTNAIPGIILQIILIPAIVIALRRSKLIE